MKDKIKKFFSDNQDEVSEFVEVLLWALASLTLQSLKVFIVGSIIIVSFGLFRYFLKRKKLKQE